MKRADVIVTPTDAMAQMIRNSVGNAANLRYVTLRHRVGVKNMSAPLDKGFWKMFENAAGLKLVYAAHPGPHKGFEILFKMMHALVKRNIEATLYLTIERLSSLKNAYDSDWPRMIGRYEDQISQLGLGDKVVFLGSVPQEQMGAIYSSCDLMVYPSLCESFGFPMIEAMVWGLPIVAAETAVNREMCRDGALYYDPLNGDAAADCVETCLDSDVRAGLTAHGQAQVAGFDWSWKRYAREFVDILESVT